MNTITAMRREVITNEVEFEVIQFDEVGKVGVHKSKIFGSLITISEAHKVKRTIEREEALRIGESIEFFSAHKVNGKLSMEEYLLSIYTEEALMSKGLNAEEALEMREYLRKNHKQFKLAYLGSVWCEVNKIDGVDGASIEALKIVGSKSKKDGEALLKELNEGKTKLTTPSMRDFQKRYSNGGGNHKVSDSEHLKNILALLLPMREEIENSTSKEAGALYDYLLDIGLYKDEDEK